MIYTWIMLRHRLLFRVERVCQIARQNGGDLMLPSRGCPSRAVEPTSRIGGREAKSRSNNNICTEATLAWINLVSLSLASIPTSPSHLARPAHARKIAVKRSGEGGSGAFRLEGRAFNKLFANTPGVFSSLFHATDVDLVFARVSAKIRTFVDELRTRR